MRRRFEYKDRELEDFLIRFYPAGNYTWIVPEGCFSVDVFLVGGGGSGSSAGGGGGAGSSSYTQDGASDGGDTNGEEYGVIKGQGHTTRDFGESGGKRNAGGGSGETNTGVVFQGGISDYSEGSGTGGSTNGSGKGGGGYGGGGGGVRYSMVYAGAGGDGTVLIRGRRYKS